MSRQGNGITDKKPSKGKSNARCMPVSRILLSLPIANSRVRHARVHSSVVMPSTCQPSASYASAAFSGSLVSDFSLGGLTEPFLLSLMTASWPPIRRPRALSNLAPNASLLRLSLRSVLRTKRWLASFLLSNLSSPSSMSLISCWADSEVREVFTVLAMEGAWL